MQRAVNTLTESIFPGIQVFDETYEEKSWKFQRRNVYMFELSSSLPLQMCLYFNCFYFPFWLVVSVIMLIVKYDYVHPLYRVVLIAVLVVVALVETVRLYLGYLGNLSEMIPELAGFWLLTLLLQCPLQLFLLFNEDTVILPMERSMNLIMITFICLELVTGYLAIKQVSKQLAMKFHLETFHLHTN